MLAPDEHISVLYIQATEASPEILLRGARRIRRNLRSTDTIFLWQRICVVVLPGTTIAGAQAVVRRVSELLVDIDYEIQLMYGGTALMLLQRLQTEEDVLVLNREDEQGPLELAGHMEQDRDSTCLLPYLAFLSHYPSHRILHLFPYELACQYQCVPVGFEQGVLTVATNQSLNAAIIDHLQVVTRRSIYLVRCDTSVVSDVLNYWRHIWYPQEKGVFS
ncbi:MAG: hypothetical protein NVSMB27_25150 [Ktedonobacteraceae bacterium]